MHFFIRCLVILSLSSCLSLWSMENDLNEQSYLETIKEIYVKHPKAMGVCLDLALLGLGFTLGGGKMLQNLAQAPSDEQLFQIINESSSWAWCGALLVGSACGSLLVKGGCECHRLIEKCTDIEGIDEIGKGNP